MATYLANKNTITSHWHLVDASGKTLGRLASAIAKYLRGKHKPQFTPFVDTGDFIVVVNAEKVTVTGNKAKDKFYYHYSGYPSGMKKINFNDLQAKRPERVLALAVQGMLPKGPLGRTMFRKLKIYAGHTHPHTAQPLKPIDL